MVSISSRDSYYWSRGGDPFSSVDELEEIVLDLDVGREVPLFFDEPSEPFHQAVEGWKGIYNSGTQKLSAVVSDKYALIQHRDSFVMAVSALRKAGVEARGVVKNFRDYVAIEMTFDGILADDGERGIELGVKIANSYNASSSFRGWGWGLRKVCNNGLYIREIIPEMAFSVVHRGRAPEISTGAIVDMVTQVRSRLHNYEEEIETAKVTPLEFPSIESVAATIRPIVGGVRAAETVVDRYWDKELETNRWDMYCALTEYASHEDLSEPKFHSVSQKSEKFLAAKTVTIIVPEDEIAIEAGEWTPPKDYVPLW